MPIGNHRAVTAPWKSAQPSWQRTSVEHDRLSLRGAQVPLAAFLRTPWEDTLQDWIVDRHSGEPKPAAKITPLPPPVVPLALITPQAPRTIDEP